jgi:hypothetical protein
MLTSKREPEVDFVGGNAEKTCRVIMFISYFCTHWVSKHCANRNDLFAHQQMFLAPLSAVAYCELALSSSIPDLLAGCIAWRPGEDRCCNWHVWCGA